MVKKKPKKKTAIDRQLSDAWEAFTRGKINRQQLSASHAHESDLVEFLDTRYGLEWQVGKRAASRMAEAAQVFREVMVRSGHAQRICDEMCSKGLSENTVAEILLFGFVHGYQEAASEFAASSRVGRRTGNRANALKAEARTRRIVEAWKATDKTLNRGARIAAVKQATGIKSDETIRKALRSR